MWEKRKGGSGKWNQAKEPPSHLPTPASLTHSDLAVYFCLQKESSISSWISASQAGGIPPPRDDLAIWLDGDYHTRWWQCYWKVQTAVRNAADLPTMPSTTPTTKWPQVSMVLRGKSCLDRGRQAGFARTLGKQGSSCDAHQQCQRNSFIWKEMGRYLLIPSFIRST